MQVEQPEPPEIVMITKLITNQIIIGKTTTDTNIIKIQDPYMVIPDPSGIQLFPYDEAIIGKKLELITLPLSSTIYVTSAGTEIRNTYLNAKMGLEREKIIL